ncbi:MAG: kelch repeat-containing protein [Candidatus Eisenbacteria bacterium]
MFLTSKRGLLGLAVLLISSIVSTGVPARASVQSVDGIWTSLPGDVYAPSARREHVAIYDQTHNRYLLFGGFGFTSTAPEYNFNEVWALTLGDTPTWSQITVAGDPPGPRKDPQWGYDPARNRMLIFGGYGQHHAGDIVYWQNDVWELSLDDPPTWTELFPAGTPPSGRLAGVSVYDPLRQRFVGFGGTAGAPVDTWSLDLSGDPTWSTIPTGSQRPDGSYGMGCIYDPIRDRMLVFGGSLGDAYFGAQNNLWELTLGDSTVWHQLSVADSGSDSLPKPRRTMTAVYDPMRDRMVIFSGFDALTDYTSSFLSDTWALSLSGDLQWQQLAPAGTTPIGRDATAAIYDPTGDRLVLYGGWSGDTMLGDTEYLTWGEAPASATITGSATAAPSAVSLHWGVSQATGAHAAVFRSGPGQPWTSVATVQAETNGAVTYVDDAVVPGTHYSYELAVSSQRGEEVGGLVSVLVPGATGVTQGPDVAFALHGVRPNPVVGRFNVSFRLPNADPARVEVIDVNGRRLITREVGGLGAGVHDVDLGSSRDFAPGMYFVRLSRAGQSLTTRAVVMGAR